VQIANLFLTDLPLSWPRGSGIEKCKMEGKLHKNRAGKADIVKEHVAFDPADVGLLGANGIVEDFLVLENKGGSGIAAIVELDEIAGFRTPIS
jgi:hypothetical protein